MAYLARAEGVSFKGFSVSRQHGRSGCQESRVGWRQNFWAGAVKMVLLIDIKPSSAAAE